MHHIAAAARAHARAPIVHASSRRPTRRASVIANVGRSKTNELTGEPDWVEITTRPPRSRTRRSSTAPGTSRAP